MGKSSGALRRLARYHRERAEWDRLRTGQQDSNLAAWIAYLDVDLSTAQAALRLPAGERGWPPGDPHRRPLPTATSDREYNPLRDPAVVRVPPKGAYARRRAQ